MANKKAAKSSKKKSAAGPFKPGSRVQVISGDCGNGRGVVKSSGAVTTRVCLDAEVHTNACREFLNVNLTALA